MNIGDIVKGRDVGLKSANGSHLHVYAACNACGKERWVPFVKGEPTNKLCKKCGYIAMRGRHLSPKSEFKSGNIPWSQGKTAETCEVLKQNGIRHSQFMKGRPTWNKGISYNPGCKHWNWKGGLTPEVNTRVNSIKWKELRKYIYERDKWMCQVCGKVCHKDIRCHHKEPYRINHNDHIDNLVTLCASCHYKEDYKYSKMEAAA